MKSKKLASLLSAFIIISGLLNITALAQPDAGIYATAQNIYVEGKAEKSCSTVTLALKDNSNNVQYISELTVDGDGRYSTKFKFRGDYSNCRLYVNDGAENITDTVIKTVAENVICVGEVDASAFTNGKMTVNASVENKYDNEGSCKLFYSFYNKVGALISAKQKDVSYDYYSGTQSFEEEVPSNTYKAKVYMWQSAKNMIPLAKPDVTLPEKDVILIGDSLGQAYSAENCRKGWGEYIGNYMANGANVINECHAGWDTVRYLYDANGWEKAKSYIGEGDIVIFGLGYNDYNTMGYEGKYCTEENGTRTLYKYMDNSFADSQELKVYPMDENIVSIPNVGDIQGDTGVNQEYSKENAFTYLYKDGETVKSYAADCFYDNMRVMLDDCKELGAEVIIRNIAARCSKTAQNMGGTYYAWNTHVLINEKCELLETEYDNVTTIDLFTETKNHFSSLYNSFPETADYFYDASGNKYGYIRSDGKLQQLADTYWLTIKNYEEFYKDGQPGQNENGDWGYLRANGSFVTEDDLHYNAAGADYIASAIAKLAKASDSPVNEYFK